MLYVPSYKNDGRLNTAAIYPTSATLKYPQDLPPMKDVRLV